MKEIPITEAEMTEWISHPTTKAQLHNLSVMVDRALKGVVGAAAKSSDPEVRGALAKYRGYEMMLKILQEKHGSDQDSESGQE